MKIPKNIRDEIKEFCELNNIKDVDSFILKNINTGFNIEKYGNAPFIKEVIVEKEVPIETIKEVIVEKEVPVEIIKEVVVEVPVEKEVIKEITIEKKVYVTDDNQVNELGIKINKLEEIINEKEKNIINIKNNLNKIEKDNIIKTTESLNKDGEIKKSKSILNKKEKEIKKLKNTILDLEKDLTNLKNEDINSKGRPFRDIYDEDGGTGGHWGSNLRDKK